MGVRCPSAYPTQWAAWIWPGVVLFFVLCLLGFVKAATDAGRPLIASDVGHGANVAILSGALGSRFVVSEPPT